MSADENEKPYRDAVERGRGLFERLAGREGCEQRRAQRAELSDGYSVEAGSLREGRLSGPKYVFLRGLGIDVDRVAYWHVTMAGVKGGGDIIGVHMDAVGGVLHVNELKKRLDTNVGAAKRYQSEIVWRAYASDAAACGRPPSGLRAISIDTIINRTTKAVA